MVLGLAIAELELVKEEENAKRYLEENPEIMNEIEQKVRANFNKAFEQSLDDEAVEEAEEPLEDEE